MGAAWEDAGQWTADWIYNLGPSWSIRLLAAPRSVGAAANTSAHGSGWRVNRRSSKNFGKSNADDIVRGATTLIFIADGDAAVSSAERHGIDAQILADKIVALHVALKEASWILLLKTWLE